MLTVSAIELELLTEQFKVLSRKSKDEGKSISVDVWKKYFVPESPTLSARLYSAFDLDKDGKVGFVDFFEGMVKCLRGTDDDRNRCMYTLLS